MRIRSAFKNSFFSVLGQAVLIVVGFFCQRTMNLLMGAELVGLNGVISNVIAILSVSEMGISTAIVYHLYSAIARRDEKEIAGLMNLYRKAYCVFAVTIFGLGMAVMPFIHHILNEVTFSLGYVRLIFFLWLVRTVLSYLLSYKRSILIADQKEYLVSIVTLIANVLNYSFTIAILQLSGNYVLALGVNISVEVISNLWLAVYVNKKYPFLMRQKDSLKTDIVYKVIDNIKNIFVMRLFSKLLLSTDKIIVSGMVSTVAAGLYSNYCLITQSILNIMLALAGALKPVLGNLFMEENPKKDVQVLRQITFVFFLCVSTASVCILSLITPFVRDLWLNEEYLMEKSFVTVFAIQFFVSAMGLPLEIAMGVTGLFERERNIAMLTTVVNLIVSLSLVRGLGVAGIAAGTILAYAVQIGGRIMVFFREYVKQTALPYWADMVQYAVITAVEMMLACLLTACIYSKGFLSFFLTALTEAFMCLGLNCLLYCRSWKWKSVIMMIKQVAHRENS